MPKATVKGGASDYRNPTGVPPTSVSLDVVRYAGPAVGSDAWLRTWGGNVDSLIQATTITRSATDAGTSASVVWPDGTPGVYTGTESATIPGAVDAYSVTYLGRRGTRTITQPTLTRNSNGAVITRPAMTVSG